MTEDFAPGRIRQRWQLRAGAVCGAVVLALVSAGCSAASPRAAAPSKAAGIAWVCRPGQAASPCATSLAATTVTAGGALPPASWPHSATASMFDCFYVHGSDGLTGIGNTVNDGLTQNGGSQSPRTASTRRAVTRCLTAHDLTACAGRAARLVIVTEAAGRRRLLASEVYRAPAAEDGWRSACRPAEGSPGDSTDPHTKAGNG